jgi:alpha-aminoadipate carrier protein LysW
MIECPECGADIDVEEDELDEGETILCDECGRSFTVAGLDPLELEPEEDEFDLDEDFDEDEEDFDEEEEEDEEDEEEEDWR